MRLAPPAALSGNCLPVWMVQALAQLPSAGSRVPVLTWQYGGCVSGPDGQTGWYASPALADPDGDDQPGVIWDSCEVVALNDANVKLKWLGPGGNCVWAGVVTGLGRSPACAD